MKVGGAYQADSLMTIDVILTSAAKLGERVKVFCLFVLMFNVTVNNCSVMSGRSHSFLGFTSTLSVLSIYKVNGHVGMIFGYKTFYSYSDTSP